jgi:uncharacterized protein (DUF1800 family)
MRTPSNVSATLTRRTAIVGSAVGAAALLSEQTTAAAQDSRRITHQPPLPPHHFPGRDQASLPDTHTRHVLTRFTAGVNDERLADVEAAGGVDAWFEQQLSPGDIPDHEAAAMWSWFPVLGLTPLQRWKRYKAGIQDGWEMMQDFANWIMLRRLRTKRQVEEMMVDFWSNLLHVASPATNVWVWRVEYEEMIRKHALGRYDDMLQAAIRHPAMGLYLNNVESTARAINENLGRELLECHTVGVEGGYTEDQIIDSARILTGFHVDSNNTWRASYAPKDHWVGRVKVMGFSSPNSQHDGREVLTQYLSYLAHHPATAQRLSRRLAVRFVSDDPSQALVSSLARVYLDSDTRIAPVLRALVSSDEFKRSVMQKVRTPVEDALATWTATRAQIAQPHDDQDAGNQATNFSRIVGQVVYDWPPPNGFPDVAPAWTGSGRILGSIRAHWLTAADYFPSQGISYPRPMDWMPTLPTTFDRVVDHVVRRTLFLECTSTMLKAACVATDLQPKDQIGERHALIQYKFPRLMVSVLDAAEHLKR